MCNEITKIAKQGRYKRIGVCPHGAAHIFWQSTHFCIPVEQLDLLMSQVLAGQLPVEYYGGDYILWMADTAVKLSDKDYINITSLFASAAEAKASSVAQLVAQGREFEVLDAEKPESAVLY